MSIVGESIESSGLTVTARSALHGMIKGFAVSGYKIITPLAIDIDQNVYSPNGFDDATSIRLSSTVPVNISGMTAGQDGGVKRLINVGSQAITILHASALSYAANRFVCSGAANITINPDSMLVIYYDGVTKRWRA